MLRKITFQLLHERLIRAETLMDGVGDICETDEERLKISAYILICHAIIEEYLEEVCRSIVDAALSQFRERGTICLALIALLGFAIRLGRGIDKDGLVVNSSTISASEIFEDLKTVLHHCASIYKNEVIKSNNGIRESNLKNLFHPVGLVPDRILLGQCDQLGISRGDFAHGYRISHETTRSEARTAISAILASLSQVEEGLALVLVDVAQSRSDIPA